MRDRGTRSGMRCGRCGCCSWCGLLCSPWLPLRLLVLLLLVRVLCSLRLPLRLLGLLLLVRLLCSRRLPLRLLGLLLLVRRTRGRNRSRGNRRSASLSNRPQRPPAS